MQTYQIIEGKVEFVTRAGQRAIVHFNADSKASFTATVEQAAQRRLANSSPEDWQGQTIRIRGWIERKKGLNITIIQPEQIELLEQAPSHSDTAHAPQ